MRSESIVVHTGSKTNKVYLRPVDHLKIKEGYAVLTNTEARSVEIISTETNIKGILKIPHTISKRTKSITLSQDVTDKVVLICT